MILIVVLGYQFEWEVDVSLFLICVRKSRLLVGSPLFLLSYYNLLRHKDGLMFGFTLPREITNTSSGSRSVCLGDHPDYICNTVGIILNSTLIRFGRRIW
jgi:hypothetical protein